MFKSSVILEADKNFGASASASKRKLIIFFRASVSASNLEAEALVHCFWWIFKDNLKHFLVLNEESIVLGDVHSA